MSDERKNYTIAESFCLPSKGIIYDKEFDPNIRLRSMTVREEMKRLSQSSMPNKVLAEIIDDCLLDKLPYSSYDLCIGDYEYLLHKLRVVTYGNSYTLLVGCPHCGSTHEEKCDLDDIVAKEFTLNELQEAREFTIPNANKIIKIKMQTPRILDRINTKVTEFKRKNPQIDYDPTPLIRLQELIDTVDGVKLDYAEMEYFISNMSAADYNVITHKIDKLNKIVGLDTSLFITCSKCGGDIRTFFRFGEEFFRPEID